MNKQSAIILVWRTSRKLFNYNKVINEKNVRHLPCIVETSLNVMKQSWISFQLFNLQHLQLLYFVLTSVLKLGFSLWRGFVPRGLFFRSSFFYLKQILTSFMSRERFCFSSWVFIVHCTSRIWWSISFSIMKLTSTKLDLSRSIFIFTIEVLLMLSIIYEIRTTCRFTWAKLRSLQYLCLSNLRLWLMIDVALSLLVVNLLTVLLWVLDQERGNHWRLIVSLLIKFLSRIVIFSTSNISSSSSVKVCSRSRFTSMYESRLFHCLCNLKWFMKECTILARKLTSKLYRCSL